MHGCVAFWLPGALPTWWKLMPMGLWSFGVSVRWRKGGTELAGVAEKCRLSGLWWVRGVAMTMPRGSLPLLLALAGFPLLARWPGSDWKAVWTSPCVHSGSAVSGMHEGGAPWVGGGSVHCGPTAQGLVTVAASSRARHSGESTAALWTRGREAMPGPLV